MTSATTTDAAYLSIVRADAAGGRGQQDLCDLGMSMEGGQVQCGAVEQAERVQHVEAVRRQSQEGTVRPGCGRPLKQWRAQGCCLLRCFLQVLLYEPDAHSTHTQH